MHGQKNIKSEDKDLLFLHTTGFVQATLFWLLEGYLKLWGKKPQ